MREAFVDVLTKRKDLIMEDSMDFIEWANDYQHYMAIRFEIERHLLQVT